MTRTFFAVSLLVSVLLPPAVLAVENPQPEINRIELRWSNAYLLRGTKENAPWILVDTGAPSDGKRLEKKLKALGVRKEQLGLIILTHGHADHSSLSAELRRVSGAKIVEGKGDEEMSKAGRNRMLPPTSWTAKLLRPIVDFKFEPFEPDLLVDMPYSLSAHGIDGEILPLPGHTQGSLVIVLKDGRAIVGDVVRGGVLSPTTPHEHFYQEDPMQNEKNVQWLLDRGVTTFYVGHGGPLDADAIRAGLSKKYR